MREPSCCGAPSVPCAGALTISIVSVSPSASLQGAGGSVLVTPAGTVAANGPLAHVGAVFALETLTLTVETADWPPWPSSAR